MPPIYWIIGIMIVAGFFWSALKSNKKRARVRLLASSATELARENDRLRHVLAEMTLDNHALRGKVPGRW